MRWPPAVCPYICQVAEKHLFPGTFSKGPIAGSLSLDRMGHVAITEPISMARRVEYVNWPGLEHLPGNGDSGCWGLDAQQGQNNRDGGGDIRDIVVSLWVPGRETGTSGIYRQPSAAAGAWWRGMEVKVIGFVCSPAHCVSFPFARLISHTPSYCDESLFGSRSKGTSWEAPWMAKGDAAKLHTLFWTPPATPRGSHSPRPKETPLRAIHPTGASETEPKVATGSQKSSMDGLDSPRPPRRERSHSLTHLNVPSTGRPHTSDPHTNGPGNPRPSPSGVTFRSPLVTPRARSISVSVPATPRQGGATQKPKPPWK